VERREALAVGFAMNARGAMEIILGLLALQAGVIGERLFVSLVVMALFTSVISGPLIRWALKLSRTRGLRDYMSSRVFIPDLRAADRKTAIRELVQAAASVTGLSANEIERRVLRREELMPTGIGSRIAIPHARIPGLTAPIVGLGLTRSGIDFDAPDGEPAQLVFLVLAPPHDDGAQVSILADISRRFSSPEARKSALQVENFTQMLALLKMHTDRPGSQSLAVADLA
jgi:mannitol/fructose-specific phosphotransferase system IIA component (Ntr-type)